MTQLAPPKTAYSPSAASGPARPGLAFVANSHTPYREHLHRRIAREIPELKLWTIFTHEISAGGLWEFNAPAEIGPVSFGEGQSAALQAHPRYALREWKKAGRIIRFLKQQNVVAVVVLGYNDLGRLRILRWCRRHGVPSFVWGDSNSLGDIATGMRRRVKDWLLPRLLRLPTGILACGRLGRAYFERYGVSPARTFIVPCEPDCNLIRTLSAERIEQTRAKFGLAEGCHRIIYCGRLAPPKRVDLLIDGFAAIAAQRPAWDLVIAGGGEEADALKARVPAGLRERVLFTGFVGDQADVSALYRLSDVLVLPSDFEPWALVIIEALAAGLAVVCSSVVGAGAELVRDGVNGRIFPPGDLPALVQCLLDVSDAAKTPAMKAAAAEVLADWYRRDDPVKGMRLALQYAGILLSKFR